MESNLDYGEEMLTLADCIFINVRHKHIKSATPAFLDVPLAHFSLPLLMGVFFIVTCCICSFSILHFHY